MTSEMVEPPGAVARISLSGELGMTSAHAPVELGHLALDDDQAGVERLLVDVSAVRFIDSSGLGGLVQLSNLARARGVQVFLVGASPRIGRLVSLAGLSSVLSVLPADPTL